MSTNTKKTLTVREFKSLLEGMDLLQGKSWTPNSTQWKIIRKKINMLEDEEVILFKDISDEVQVSRTSEAGQSPVQHVRGGDHTTSAPSQPRPMIQSSVLEEVPVPHAPPKVKNGKTPDIDTSKSGYVVSAFE